MNVEVALTKWLKTSLGFDYLVTENKSTNRRLPLTSPPRVMWAGRLEDKPRDNLSKSYAEIRLTWCDDGLISGPDEPFPFNTNSYLVFGFSGGTTFTVSEDVNLALDLLIHNLFNTRYRDFLYTYKGVADMPGRVVRMIVRLRF